MVEKNCMKHILRLLVLLIINLFINSCMTLSQKAQDRNIRIVTSLYMVQGMQNIYAYTTDVGSMWSIEEIGIMAANNAVDDGWHNITILVQYVKPGSTGRFIPNKNSVFGGYLVGVEKTIVEISYWKRSSTNIPEKKEWSTV